LCGLSQWQASEFNHVVSESFRASVSYITALCLLATQRQNDMKGGDKQHEEESDCEIS
jgi:hypothetical protein